ncbi:CRISPR-associated RAMP protein, partial [Archaeoglobales archaeon]
AIDRRTGAVYRGALYQVEFVEPGARFRFFIRATNLPNYSIGLLAKILRMINEGWVRLGGFKTRGFGKVKVENLSLKVRGEIDGYNLKAIDEFDEQVNLKNIADYSNGWLSALGGSAWNALKLFEEVWDRANLKK